MTKSKVAMVFGGSRGIGAALVCRLAADGYAVAFTYSSDVQRSEELVSALQSNGKQVFALRANSVDSAEIRRAVDQVVAQLGAIDTVVVNAGVLRMGSISTMSEVDLDLLLDVNVRGVYLAIQAAVAQMRDGGRVITIGSNTAERTGNPEGTVYAMTKAAVASMVKGLALDLAPRRITVNNIQPGPTYTDMTSAMAEQLESIVPLGRIGEPSEIGELASYIASEKAGYMTGASLTIDGGFIL
ncbi:SDR family oxidoreductase [Hydrocarboniphaga effusa]|jgi:3-oxoacyl-[acyl-carrier protein] reductase|uniref:SDR family oxidoreductase n=1 Tax=Hydrocarboniphaga effusa TaxID=243629 RepID=UPI003137B7E5